MVIESKDRNSTKRSDNSNLTDSTAVAPTNTNIMLRNPAPF